MDYHCKDSEKLLNYFVSNETKGLSHKEAIRRLEKYGENEIREKKSEGVISMFFSQFKDFMIIILLLSAVISLAVSFINNEGEYYDFFIILGIVLLNGIIGTIQEYNAEKAIESLKSISSPTATVIRDGKKKLIESKDVVVGDIALIKAGNIVPADIRLLDCVELSSEESSLTGESVPVYKDSRMICAETAGISERKNMLFAGCGISSGHGKGLVVATAMDTQIGKIANMLENEKSPKTPLQAKLDKTGKVLGITVIGICMIIFALGLFKSIPILEMLLIAISLAVAAIPEGLAAVVTIVLSVGVKRMVRKKAIVRKLPAVETLGGVNVICSDKTGTLTENKMTVVEVSCFSGLLQENSEERRLILGLASLCNNTEKAVGGKLLGMPTETAIVKAFENFYDDFLKQFPRVGEIPFTSDRKLMSTVHQSGDIYLVVTKGAPDYIIKMCSYLMVKGNKIEMTDYYRNIILKTNKNMAQKALRVLAVAKKECDNIPKNDDEAESKLTFCGLIGIEDPLRKEAKEAVKMCKKAGIIPVMITGDQTATALAIAEKAGIYDSNQRYMTGEQLRNINSEELSRNIHKYRVFTRVSPEDKVKIVRAFQSNNNLVAMTGDGINDAPALKASDIGCAMGKNGTEVAKSAADMILTDDNFATIVEAVREGRTIFSNIRKTIHFLLSCNTGEILLIFLSFLMGIPVPLLATQILWVNLVTDSFPALALGAAPAKENIMEGKFVKGKSEILNKNMFISLLLEGGLIGVVSLIAFIVGRNFFDFNPNEPLVGRTMCFAVLCLSQLVHSFNISSEYSLFSVKTKINKYLVFAAVFCAALLLLVIVFPAMNEAFSTVMLNSKQWIIVLVLSICPLIVAEIEKIFTNKIWKKSK